MRPKKIVGVLAALILLTVAFVTMVPTALATQELRVTDHNLNALQNWGTWTPYRHGELLRWEYGPPILDANYQRLRWVGNIPAITMADHQGYYWGECVSMAKALSKSTVVTRNWQRGPAAMTYNVMRPGTVIATFFKSDGGYQGHVAILRGYTYSNGQRTGILVWDQNHVSSRVIGRHTITASGYGVNNANNYYVVEV